jgi:hypothetical protein
MFVPFVDEDRPKTVQSASQFAEFGLNLDAPLQPPSGSLRRGKWAALASWRTDFRGTKRVVRGVLTAAPKDQVLPE